MKPYAIRLARADDVAKLPAIELAAAALFRAIGFTGDFLGDARDERELESARRDGLLWVATAADDAPVGFAMGRLLGGAPHLEEIDVHPDHGRRGIGAALVATVVAWARAGGADAITLSTFAGVPWNAPFYARLGFVALDAATLPAPLAALRAREAAQGLPIERRVVMRRALGS